MYDQPKYKPLAASPLWTGREVIPSAGGGHRSPQCRHLGRHYEWSARVCRRRSQAAGDLQSRGIQRGRERYDIYCAPCHGLTGDGKGYVTLRGFPHPPSYHTDRLREAPDTYLFDVITHGYGAMYAYAERLAPEDRWAVVAYVRALQLSQHAHLADVPRQVRDRLEASP